MNLKIVGRLAPFLAMACIGGCLPPYKGTSTHADGGASSDASTDGGITDGGGIPFEPLTAQSYVPKVKNLLTGLPATDAEIAAVTADPTAIRGLIDTWMALPQFETKMVDFFRNAFQQNDVDIDLLFTRSLGLEASGIYGSHRDRLNRALMDSFALTAWELVKEGAPFNTTVTTDRYMMNTGLMNMYAFVDEMLVSDDQSLDVRFTDRNVTTSYTVDPAANPPLADSANPASPSFMIWHNPAPGCTEPAKTVTLPPNDNYAKWTFTRSLEQMLTGKFSPTTCGFDPNTGIPNQYDDYIGPQFTDADWSDWRMVTITHAAPTDVTSPQFFDIPSLRGATTMNLHVPRVGFFGTLGFQGNWPTNGSNVERVTANQSLIVSLGMSIAPPDNGSQFVFPSTPSETAHATDPACAGCHASLDPYKQYFRQSNTVFYSEQTDPMQIGTPAGFSIGGVMAQGAGIDSVAMILATHPRFALAWALKLHFWANSVPALEDDPEVVRIANAFQAANYDWKTLVRELFSSPLVTYASATKTTSQNGVILSIARRDQFCGAMSNRLALTDVCGMTATTPSPAQAQVNLTASMIAADTYYRDYALPSLPTNPDLMFRRSVESTCKVIADQLVDVNGGPSRYQSTDAPTAIADMVANVVGIPPGDPRSAQFTAILMDNFTAASATQGASPTDALKSTFILACLSPNSVLVGF